MRVLISGIGASLNVRVENDPATEPGPGLVSTGQGLVGLRERVEEIGGNLTAGPAQGGGWVVLAEGLPCSW